VFGREARLPAAALLLALDGVQRSLDAHACLVAPLR